MNALPPSEKNACPTCGQPNRCSVAAGEDAQGCWCMHTPVSRTALARLPQEERGQRCICPVCARPSEGPDGTAAPL